MALKVIGIFLIIIILMNFNQGLVKAQENKKIKVLFIHHSTGANLINEGNLREEFFKLNLNVELWDHSYNRNKILPSFLIKLLTHTKLFYETGLSDKDGRMTGLDYDIVLSNNSPKEYAEIFSRNPQDKTLSAILQYDLVLFKNCFPTTEIKSETQLEEDKKYYQIIRESLVKYPNKKFILLTSPSLRKEATKPEYAKRAKDLNAWLFSKDFLGETRNLFVFDFFGLLSDNNGYLKKEYASIIPFDSHPNQKANQQIAPLLAKYIVEVVDK